MKTCRKCGESKPLDAFNKNVQKDDDLDIYCRVCTKEKNRLYRETRREERAERRERRRARLFDWCLEAPELGRLASATPTRGRSR